MCSGKPGSSGDFSFAIFTLPWWSGTESIISPRYACTDCQHPLDHRKSKENSRKTFTSALLTTKAFDCVDHNRLWKILQEMGIPDHLTCLLRNLYAGQEATVRTRHGKTDRFQYWKGVHQGCILLPCVFNLYAEYIM